MKTVLQIESCNVDILCSSAETSLRDSHRVQDLLLSNYFIVINGAVNDEMY